MSRSSRSKDMGYNGFWYIKSTCITKTKYQCIFLLPMNVTINTLAKIEYYYFIKNSVILISKTL